MSLQSFTQSVENSLNQKFNITNIKSAYTQLFFQPQVLANSCAINTQLQILEERLGMDFDELKLAAYAQKHDFFLASKGTPLKREYLNMLLNKAGIESQVGNMNGIEDLKVELNDGNDVIVPADSNELYKGMEGNAVEGDPFGADHNFRILGYHDGVFSIQDPVRGLIHVPERVLSDAWQDSNFLGVVIPPSDVSDLYQIQENVIAMQDSINSGDIADVETENYIAQIKNVFDPGVEDFVMVGAVEQSIGIEDLPKDVQDQMHQINIDVENILATGGYIALMQFLKDNPQKQKTVTKVALALGAFDAFTDFSGDKVKLDFEINPLLITSLAYYVSQVASNSKNVKMQRFALSFSNTLSRGFRVIEYAGYAAIGIEVIEFLTNVEFTDIFLEIVDAADFLDIFGNISDVASTGIDITEGLATLGLGIALSRAVRWIFKKINKDDIIKIKNLTRKTTPKKTLAKLLESEAPVPLLMGPYCEMIKEC